MKNIIKNFMLLISIILLSFTLSACSNSNNMDNSKIDEQQTKIEITDMAGRKLTIPKNVASAFPANPTSAIYIYTIAPDKLLGWNYELNDIEKNMIPEKYHTLPNFGMNDSINYEAVISKNPTVAILVGSTNDKTKDEADKLSTKLGIPVIIISTKLTDSPKAYELLGKIFNEEETAKKLSDYCTDTLNIASSLTIPESEQVKIYYGNGSDSLQTAPKGTSHSELIELIKGINVADVKSDKGSRVKISAEQLLSWNPDLIILNGEPKKNTSGATAANSLKENPTFQTLNAVKNNKVFGTPNSPFSWIDRPTGPNRIIGIRWLLNLVYPNYIKYDVNNEIKTFFKLFYHIDLTDSKLNELFK